MWTRVLSDLIGVSSRWGGSLWLFYRPNPVLALSQAMFGEARAQHPKTDPF